MSSLLLFSEALFFWCLATATPHLSLPWSAWRSEKNPLVATGPATRAAAVAGVVLVATWSITPSTVLLAALSSATVILLYAGRPPATSAGLLAELELAMTALFAGASGTLIWMGHMNVGFPGLRVAIPEQRLAFLYLAASGMVLAIWQSGNIVRGILQKSGIVLPRQKEQRAGAGYDEAEDALVPEASSPRELKHGRLIGYLERILIVVLVVKGSYEGLGFLIAAKGLIRASEFEDRQLAEYFLVGSLLSVVCALAIGLSIQYALAHLW